MASSSDNNIQRGRKVFISEDDIASVLTRYSAPTILALLKEVAQYPDVKIDWNVLVKKTTTGITNAAEYQKLWRHLAYNDKLPETVEEKLEEQPLDYEDSDLEYELEAFLPPTDEASLEAAACVKVLLTSGLSDDSGRGSVVVEAPLPINVPTWQDSKSPLDNPLPCSLEGINITVPVSVQKKLSTALKTNAVTTAEGLDATVSNAGGQPAKRKRKPWKAWTAEEDNLLIAAVKKLGEKNWAKILKADFKGDRTSAQLAYRWTIISKKTNANLKRSRRSRKQPQITAQQLATTNRAVSLALNMPVNNSLSAAYAASVVPNRMIQAAAVAAGARIATPSTAKSLLKAAQPKTGVHISTIGKSSMLDATLPSTPNHSGTGHNVHYICTDLPSASVTTYSTAVPSVSPPPPPAMKGMVSFSALTTVSTSCGTIAAGKRINSVKNVGVKKTAVKEKKVKSSPKEVVKNSSKDSEIRDLSNEEKVKNLSKEEQVKPKKMEIDCSSDITKDGKQDNHAALPYSHMVIEDQTTQNLSTLPNVEAAASDPMQLDNHHIENVKENTKNSPGTAN
ncbi:hypothetical protein MKW98_004883 [Papaver atlanticum]|uniref:MYB transcription factor n=1 Tax=Papaver atlanticum TaxID=357466 RepID=A0AAD4RXJ4_9MAGN|nr:hypothetical protein MKW98_004883 [Papaver atlanticum]